MKYTKAPWKFGKWLGSRSGEWVIHYDAKDRGQGIAICETVEATGKEVGNARRIVACINACEGISTEDLEIIGLGGLLKSIKRSE